MNEYFNLIKNKRCLLLLFSFDCQFNGFPIDSVIKSVFLFNSDHDDLLHGKNGT